MTAWPMGVFACIDAGLGVPLEVAHELGVPTVHLHTPHRASRSDDRVTDFLRQLAQWSLKVTCVFAGFEGESYANIPTVAQTVGLVPKATRHERMQELLEIADFARTLAVDVVGLHIGFIPHDRTSTNYQEVVAVARVACDHLVQHRQALHLETGQEPADVLLAFLGDVERGNLFINFDPANMILYGVGEPLSALRKLGAYVCSVHCKDAKWSSQPGVTWGVEVPIGRGDVNFEGYLRTLAEIGYAGPLTIEREIPSEPARQKVEIAAAVALLKDLMQKVGVA